MLVSESPVILYYFIYAINKLGQREGRRSNHINNRDECLYFVLLATFVAIIIIITRNIYKQNLQSWKQIT